MKYFLHDTSASEDEKITELFMQFGYEGVGLFFTILEKIGKQEKPIKTIVLKRQLNVGKKLEKCWFFMEEIGLILSQNGDTFNINILNFSEKYQIKKEKTAKRVSEWRERQKITENVTSYERVSNAPKVKLSKVNKKNIKKSVTIVPLSEAENIFLSIMVEVTGRSFKILDDKTRKQFNELIKAKYKRDDFRRAATIALSEMAERNKEQYLTPEFITRPIEFQKYVTMVPKQQNNNSYAAGEVGN